MTLKYWMTGTYWIYRHSLGTIANQTFNYQKMLNTGLFGDLEEAIYLVSVKLPDLILKLVLSSKMKFFKSELQVSQILKFALINYNILKDKFQSQEQTFLWFICKNIFGCWVGKFIIKISLCFVMIYGVWIFKQWYGQSNLFFLT